jgi:hypothetical protein
LAFPPPGDPAEALWHRVAPEKVEQISILLNHTPVPIGEVASALGLDVISVTLPSDISGLIRKISPNEERYEIQVNNTDVPVRQRFTVAHEVAHFLIHRHMIGTDGITDSILYRSKLSDRNEAEANRLAAAMLLPWDKVREWHQVRYGCAPQAHNLDEIAKAFRVSGLAVGFRFGF